MAATNVTELSPKDLIQQALENAPEVRPFPAAVTQMMAACQDPNVTAGDFEKIVECDPALAMRLLRFANCPLYGLKKEVRSVGHATMVLGIAKLRNLALSLAGADMFSSGNSAGKERKAMWHHSLGCASLARILAKSYSETSPDDAFLAGVFHDVGKLLLFDVVPDVYADVNAKYSGNELIETEKLLFGVTHQEIGLKSAHSWGLPKDIKSAIGYHHCPDNAPINSAFAKIVGTANDLALAWGIGTESGEDAEMDDELANRLDIDAEALGAIRDAACESYLEVSQTLGSDN